MKRKKRAAKSLGFAASGILAALAIAGAQPASADRLKLDRAQPQAYLLQIEQAPTLRAFRQRRDEGLRSAKRAARGQKSEVRRTQNQVIGELPDDADLLYRTHSVIAGLGIQASETDQETLAQIPGVRAVYPVAPKELRNASAVPLQAAPTAWQATGFLGQGQRIAVIDTGLDYTHADFGGPGTVSAYDQAHAAADQPLIPGLYSPDKMVGAIDLVGDSYNADPTHPGYQPVPHPDPNPLDCGGHGSHVAGSAAGYGVEADGSTYAGPYDETTDFGAMKIGPGMAPEAGIFAIKVFGCAGSTSVVTKAIDRAVDPDGNGDPSDRADVINLSLGSDFGSVQDGDSVAADAAVRMGVSVVAAAGNAGDHTDISGSPGDAPRVLSVASTIDAESKVDGANVVIGGIPDLHAVTRSVQYDWKTGPDLSGPVVEAPAGNADACAPYAGTPFTGKVVLTEWHDSAPACPSATSGENLAAAGAVGFIFGSDSESFSVGINGSDQIPGVLMVASGAQAIRDALAASWAVAVDGTELNAITKSVPEDIDKVSSFSSRGSHATGSVKPDVAAVGSSVFSAAVGAGSEGTGRSGTSMASPMVAGLAALVRQANPGWSPLQVKAGIMNTAAHDLFVDGSANPASDRYGPPRVGAGRIDAAKATANKVLAYDPAGGAVSVSFGPVEAAEPVLLNRQVTVDNQSASAVTYGVRYDPINTVPGAEFTVSPSEVTIAPGAQTSITVSLEIEDPSALTKAVDPTIGDTAAGLPRETLAEAFGRILLDPADSAPELRVPVYASPRPAAAMSQPDSLTVQRPADAPEGPEQTGTFALSGQGVGTEIGDNGRGDSDPANDIFSIAAGFELQALSGQSPECGGEVETSCWRLPEEKYADLAMVGFTSDAPTGSDPANARGYFAVAVHGPWAIPANKAQIWISLDLDRDAKADLYVFNTRLGEDDIFVSVLYDPAKPDGEGVVDVQGINGRLGDLDTALYDSDAMVLPVSLGVLSQYGADPENPRISYGIEGYSHFSPQAIDAIGVNPATGDLEKPLSVNLFEPGIRVTDQAGNGPLINDQPGEELTVTRNVASWKKDRGKAVMMVHFHNRVGQKAQLIGLDRSASTTELTVEPDRLTARVSPVGRGLPTPTGTVTFMVDRDVVGVASVEAGVATMEHRVPPGATRRVEADYRGDIGFEPSSDLVMRADPGLTAKLKSRSKKNRFGWYRKAVRVKFRCRPHGSPLATRCPRTRRLTRDGRGQKVRASIRALDGGQASLEVKGIKIDRSRPKVKIRGIRRGASYHRIRRARCVARDRTSGVRSCVIRIKRKGNRVIYRAKAKDKAGNRRTARKWVRLRR